MFVLKSLEKTILLQSKIENEKMNKAMSVFNIHTKRSLFSKLFNKEKAQLHNQLTKANM